jgi:hypothetical protein
MNQRRGQFEEAFALTAADPGAWVEQAQGMTIAAEPILKSLLEILDESQNRPGIRLRKLAYVRAYMLLMGFGFENLLKAIAAKRGLLATNPNLTLDRGLSREKGGHSLTGLARSLQLALTDAEQEYLERLEEYVYWAGRYPVSLKRDTYVDGHSARRLSFITSDPTLGGELFDKLVKLVESSA